nr:PREDICTED: odorant receptor Or1-like [Tribolium castaneum]|eukprot:XP_008197157.2 PREDICTED: odorant receptor Or1-like [Tribolium castaneum]
MQKFDWRSMIKMNIVVLRCVGLWPSGEESYKPGVYTIYASTVLTLFLLGHIFFQAVNVYFIRNNLSAVTGTIYILLIEILLVFKVYYLVKNMTVLKQLLKMLETEMFQPRNSTQINEIQADMKFWQMLIRFLWVSVMCSNLFWAIYPLVDNAGKEKRFPFLAWYPYDAQKSPYYEITYVYQTISVNYMSSIHVSVDALAGALNVYNGNQFDILCDNLRNLHRLTKNGTIDAGRNFRYCLKHHKHILE